MSRGIFVTGTDTGVGKTVVTAGILRYLRNLGVDAVPVKPVQTGGIRKSDGLTAPDLDFSLAVSGIKPEQEELTLMSPYVYEPAFSPHLAGRLAHSYVETQKITSNVDKLLENRQTVVVEGAGGILVPINENELMIDLMMALGFPVVLVSRPGLGTINHTLLSVKALVAAGFNIIGVVFVNTEEPIENKDILIDNPEVVARFGDVEVLGSVRYFPDLDLNADIWDDFEADMPRLNRIYEVISS